MDALSLPGRLLPCPFTVRLHREVLLSILSYLDGEALLRLGLTSKQLFTLTSDPILWEALLSVLRATDTWTTAATNACTRLASTAKTAKNAYWVEVNENHRNILTMDDLTCGNVWNFRFKAAGGELWTQADPWHRGAPPMGHLYTRTGHRVRFTACPYFTSRHSALMHAYAPIPLSAARRSGSIAPCQRTWT